MRSKRASGMPPIASRRRVASALPDDSVQLFIARGSPNGMLSVWPRIMIGLLLGPIAVEIMPISREASGSSMVVPEANIE